MTEKAKEIWLSADLLRSLLSYDERTGKFTWLVDAQLPRAAKGNVAGHMAKHGYWVISISHRKFMAHRLAWLYVHGEWPKQLDHENGNRSDNRISNLRLADLTQNQANSTRPNKQSGLPKGVSFERDTGRYRAGIKKSGKSFNLGSYLTPEEAHEVYMAKARELFGEFARAA